MKIPYRNPWFIAAVIIVLVGVIWYFNSSKKTTTTPVTATATTGTLVQSVSGSGSLVAKIQADVTSPDYGRVDSLLIKNGDEVTADQPLLRFHSLATPEEKAKALASLLSAQDSLSQAKTKLTSLTGSALTAQQQYQDAQKNEQISSMTVQSTQLAYSKSQVDAKKALTDARQGVVDAASAQDKATSDLGIVSSQIGQESATLATDAAKIGSQQSVVAAKNTLTQAQRDQASAKLKTQSAQQSLNAAQTTLQNQQTSIAAAQANYNASRLSYQILSDASVTAPVAGRIVNLSLIPGQVVGNGSSNSSSSSSLSSSSSSNSSSSSSSSGSGTKLFSIIDFSSLRATVSVSEVDIPNVKMGQPTTLTFDALPDKTFAGSVTNVDSVGTTTSGVTNYNVEITLSSLSPELKPGMSVSASIITNTENHVLLVPSSAVHTANGRTTVDVLRNGQTVTVDVAVGDTNDTETVVTDGLKEGDKVVTNSTTSTTSGSGSLFGGGRGGFQTFGRGG